MVRSVLCSKPWDTIYIYAELKKFSFCCLIMFDLPDGKVPSNQEELMELFNSPIYQQYRKALASNNLKCVACERCPYASLKRRNTDPEAIKTSMPTYSLNESEEYKSYIAEVKDAYYKGMSTVNYPPASFQLILSYACNLRCIMCHQEHKAKKDTLAMAEDFKSLLSTVNWNRIDQIMLSGGEVFFNKDGRQILEHLYKMDVKKTRIEAFTNGHHIIDHIDGIATFDNFALNISIDGAGASYEKIRRGGKWQNLSDNLDAYNRLKKVKGWNNLIIYSIVMKSSLHSINDLLDFADEKEATIAFMILEGLFEKENFFMFPWILKENEAEETFRAAIAKAEEMGRTDDGSPNKKQGTIDSIEMLIKYSERENLEDWQLEYRLERYKTYVLYPGILQKLDESGHIKDWADCMAADMKIAREIGCDSIADELEHTRDKVLGYKEAIRKKQEMTAHLRDRNVVIFGAGWQGNEIITKNEIEKWGLTIKAVGDQDSKKIGTQIKGIPVVDASRMLEFGDMIIVSSMDFEKQMMSFISGTFGDGVETVLYNW